MVQAAAITPVLESGAPKLKAGFENVINHSFYFWENGSTNRTSIAKDVIENAINSIKMRQPRFDELSVNGQINLMRQELRAMFPDKNVY